MKSETEIKLEKAFEEAQEKYKNKDLSEGKRGVLRKQLSIATFDLLCYRADKIYKEYYSSSLGSTTK